VVVVKVLLEKALLERAARRAIIEAMASCVSIVRFVVVEGV
jgi:hypothetical protein